MAKQINAKNLAVMIPASLLFNASIGLSTAYFSELPFLGPFLLANLFCHIPMSLAVSDAIRQELGLRSPAQISGNWTARSGRKITINAGEKNKKDIFLSLLPGPSQQTKGIDELKTISIFVDNENHEVPMSKIKDFIYSVWARQRQGHYGLSRRYWTRERHPRLSTLDYKLLMTILKDVPGLIINRGERKSGYLSVSPKRAIDLIQSTF